MRAVWISKYGGPEVLEVRETPDLVPAAGQVRIRTAACGLNFAEMMARQGLYPDAPKAPCIVGYEAAGTIDAVGPGVDGGLTGKRVAVLSRFGAHADQVCVPAENAFPIPNEMSFEEAAAIPVNYLTAYQMLFRVASIHPGESVLIHMAAGGVGLAVLQLCRTVEGIVTYGTASVAKHEVLRANGCVHPIDYHTTDYFKEIMRITGGKGVDVVLDPLGGNDWRKGYRLLRPAGRLVAFGFANMASGNTRNLWRMLRQIVTVPIFTPMGLMDKNRSVAGVNLGHLWDDPFLPMGMNRLLILYREGQIKPHIDSSFPFAQAAQAHLRVQEGKNIGKVVMVP
ncbi:MAG TPA: medium chain dehydrogenase/reductase family protein [Candidatus Binataceae bacterium]|nr:medium chain dehydrogenase/reductase family protein [Candidatus Binataceae bacterium]